MEGGENKDRGLSHTRLGLADDIHAKNCLGDAFVLNFGGVLETAVNNGTETFGLEDEIFEA